MSWFCALEGDHEQALAGGHQALALQRDLDDRTGQAVALDSLGYVHHQLGQHRQAIRRYKQSLDLFVELADQPYQAAVLGRLGDVRLASGQRAAALDSWKRALKILDVLGHPDAATIRTKIHALAER